MSKIFVKNPQFKFINYFKKVKGLFFLDLFFALIVALATVATPFLTQMITKFAQKSDFYWLFVSFGFLISIFVVRLIATYVITYWGHLMGIKMEVAMRRDALDKMHKIKMNKFDSTPIGSFISRVVTDLKDIPEFSHHGPEDAFIAVVTAIGGFAYAFMQSWIIGLVLLFIFIIGVVIIYHINVKWKLVWTKIRESTSTLSAAIGQQAEAIAEIKSFNAEEFEKKKFADLQENYSEHWRKFYRFEGFFTVANTIVILATTTIVLMVGSFLLAKKEIDFPQLMGLNMAAAMLTQPMQKFVSVYTQLSRGVSAIERYYEYMNLDEEDNSNQVIAPFFKGKIEFINVNFSYKTSDGVNNVVFKNFNLIINPGEKVAFVGETGIGKSTLLKLLLRFYDIQSGEILIDDQNIYQFDLNSLRKQLCYIQQMPIIFNETIRKNVIYNNDESSENEFKNALDLAQAKQFVESLEHKEETLTGPSGAQLSGGQKQRISIARSLLSKSSVLLLDEATSSLDNITEKKVKTAFDNLSKNKTSLIVAHRLSTIKDADRIVVLGKGGVILEDGTYSQLMNKKGYLYNLNNQ